MNWQTLLFIVGIILLIAGSLYLLVFSKKEEKSIPSVSGSASNQMQLGAYERLTLLADRIALPNLISRLNQSGFSAKDMQVLITQTIRQEFDYNITQQIYVSADAWNAIKTLKDQNLLIVNQIAASLPEDASGFELNKKILDFMIADNRGQLHDAASVVLSSEAKKLL
jgi:hypothetical protein